MIKNLGKKAFKQFTEQHVSRVCALYYRTGDAVTAYKMHCLPFYLKTSASPSTFTSEKLVIRMGDFWKLHRGMPFFCFFFIKHCLFLRFASTCCCKQNKKLATEGDNVMCLWFSDEIYNQLTAGILQLFKKLLRKKHMLSRLALRISKYDVYMTYP